MGVELLLLETTLPGEWGDAAVAQFSSLFITAGLAACVHRQRISSAYEWEGEVCDEREWVIRLKTSESKLSELIAVLEAEHPYDEPQIIHWPADAGPSYLAWVGEKLEG